MNDQMQKGDLVVLRGSSSSEGIYLRERGNTNRFWVAAESTPMMYLGTDKMINKDILGNNVVRNFPSRHLFLHGGKVCVYGLLGGQTIDIMFRVARRSRA